MTKSETRELSNAELTTVTGGGWKGKLLKWGIPTVLGGAYAWVEDKFKGKK